MPDNILSTVGLVLVMGLLFWLLLIRPQQRRVKEQGKMMESLAPGATVMLSSGIIAKVVEIGDTQVLVELAPGLEMTVLKQVVINTSATDEFDGDADVVPVDGELTDPVDGGPADGTTALSTEPVTGDVRVTGDRAADDEVVRTEDPEFYARPDADETVRPADDPAAGPQDRTKE